MQMQMLLLQEKTNEDLSKSYPFCFNSFYFSKSEFVSEGINTLRNPEMGILLITHYQRMLNYIKPDQVHVMVDGGLVPVVFHCLRLLGLGDDLEGVFKGPLELGQEPGPGGPVQGPVVDRQGQPHPPVHIPGGGSVETYDFCIDNTYSYSYLSFSGYIRAQALMNG